MQVSPKPAPPDPARRIGVSSADLAPLSRLDRLPGIEPLDKIRLGPGEIDIWVCFYESIDDPEIIAAYDALMTDEERERHRRFVFARHRLQFLATRALCRWVLSRYAAVDPAAWCFESGEYGKPAIDTPIVNPPIWFNLSNTVGLVACAVSNVHAPLGIDVELVDRKTDLIGLADRYFAPAEVTALHALPEARHRERFFSYWTLKESYIKARGLGLRIPLDQFAFELDGPGPIGIAFDPRLGDEPNDWRFALLQASPEHLLAVGAKTGADTPMRLRSLNSVPLRDLTGQSRGGDPG
jgi:4'-phosphopantetheinyl transferase